MKAFDARKLGNDALYNLRKKAIGLYVEKYPIQKIATTLKVSYSAVRKWVVLYQTGKEVSLKLKKRGATPGPKKSSIELDEKIKWLLIHQKPEDFHLPYRVWSKKSIHLLLKKVFGIHKSYTQIGKLETFSEIDSFTKNRYPKHEHEFFLSHQKAKDANQKNKILSVQEIKIKNPYAYIDEVRARNEKERIVKKHLWILITRNEKNTVHFLFYLQKIKEQDVHFFVEKYIEEMPIPYDTYSKKEEWIGSSA